jgi:hypothetical protein
MFPEFSYQLLGSPIIFQGMIFSITDESDNARHVIEWCMKKDKKYAYLTLVGVTVTGEPIPFNDPEFPTIILAVPRHLSTVPSYPTHFLTPKTGTTKLEKESMVGKSQFSLEEKERTTRWTTIVKSTSRIIKKVRGFFKK